MPRIGRPPPRPAPTEPPVLLRVLAWLSALTPHLSTPALLLAALAVAAVGLARLRPVARELVNPTALRIEWVDLPIWLAHPNQSGFLEERAAEAGLSTADSIHDPGLAARVATNLSHSVWLAKVERVHVQADGVVRVAAHFREPLALVERSGYGFLIDTEGVLLDWQVRLTDDLRQQWYVVSGVAAPPPSRPGLPWPGDDLQTAMRLVRFFLNAELSGHLPFRGALRAIDVGNFKRRRSRMDGELRLVTVDPLSPIDWGLPPGDEAPIEPQAEIKLAWLVRLFGENKLLTGALSVRDPEGPRWTERG